MGLLAVWASTCCVALALVPVLAQQGDDAEKLYELASNQWFEGPSSRVDLSDDGRWAMFRRAPANALVALATGQRASDRLRGTLDVQTRALFCGHERLARFGQRGPAKGWFIEPSTQPDLTLPDDARLKCAGDGSVVAYVRASRPNELVVKGKTAELAGRITAMAFAPDNSTVYAVAYQRDGLSELVKIDVITGVVNTVTNHLDAAPNDKGLAVAADGKAVYMPLASDGAPMDRDRHRPDATRWLRIFEIDLTTLRRRPVVTSDHDNYSPVVASGSLYWVRNAGSSRIAVMRTDGSVTRTITVGQLPFWSPDGRRLSFTVGDWRLADWALNLDGAVIELSDQATPTSAPQVFVRGFHEDFPAVWSPDGRWVAYHSHRSEAPVVEYGSAGSTDDIYLRRADDVNASEIRLTDFGWEAGSPDWSPDGRRLVFTSWTKNGRSGLHRIFVVTIETETGKPLRHDPLALPDAIKNPRSAAWSPDGKSIAIEDDAGGDDRTLWVVQSDGTEPRRVIDYHGTTYGGIDWLPGGRTLVYSGLADDRMQLFAVTPGSAPKQLSRDAANLIHPQVSPDGRWIAATRIEQSQQVWKAPLAK